MPRTRAAALLAALLVTGGTLVAAAPAEARTWDHDRVEVLRFTVAGSTWTLHDAAVGQTERTIHVGQHSGSVWRDHRLTVRDDRGRVVLRTERNLYRAAVVVEALATDGFRTEKAYRAAVRRALAVPAAAAKARYLRDLRIDSVSADVESNVALVLDRLAVLPADVRPDFTAITPIHSDEYRGSVTISGTDRTHWSVIVRDEQDGWAELYDAASGSGTSFRI